MVNYIKAYDLWKSTQPNGEWVIMRANFPEDDVRCITEGRIIRDNVVINPPIQTLETLWNDYVSSPETIQQQQDLTFVEIINNAITSINTQIKSDTPQLNPTLNTIVSDFQSIPALENAFNNYKTLYGVVDLDSVDTGTMTVQEKLDYLNAIMQFLIWSKVSLDI